MTDSTPPTTAIADVLHILGGGGVLTPPLSPFTAVQSPIRGPATTVLVAPAGDSESGPLDALYAHLDRDLEGSVVVLAGGAQILGAVWGQIFARAAARSGAVAAVVDGYVRDRTTLADERLPVLGRAEATMGAIGLATVVAVDVPITIGTSEVRPGDCIVLDEGGAVVLERERADHLLACADDYATAERALLDDLTRGVPLTEAYDHKRRAVRRIRVRR
jgi:4-hydroxy-4-methyl-2-oxoglutarate aldolase